MKITLIFLAVLGLACTASISNVQDKATRTLEDDWIEFVTLIPRGPIINILVTHLATDPELTELILYMVSDDFESIVVAIDQEPDFLNLLDYFESIGMGVYDFLNSIHDFLGYPPVLPPVEGDPVRVSHNQVKLVELMTHVQKIKVGAEGRTLASMWQEIVEVWPSEEVRAFHADKLETSTEYRALFDNLASQECRDLVDKVIALQAWQDLLVELRAVGINVEALTQWIRNVFGWTL